MNIIKNFDKTNLTINLEGRLDTTTAPKFEMLILDLDNITSLIIDMEKLDYVSSAGLRVLLTMQKKMNNQGKMIVKNINDIIREVFEVTGFDTILTIE